MELVGHRVKGFKKLKASWLVYIEEYESHTLECINQTSKSKVSGLLKKSKNYDFLLVVDMLE